MDINIKKGKFNGKIVEVVTSEEYSNNKNIYDTARTVIEKNGIMYPIRGKNDKSPGYYNKGVLSFYKDPSIEQMEDYSVEKNTIDFSNPKNITEIIENTNSFRSLEREILTTPENIFILQIRENDSPEMVGMKEAINEKHIDFDKYSDRFEKSFNNIKKALTTDETITLTRIKKISNNLDMKATLILEDKNSIVPNPIGRQIVIDITGEGEE